MFPFKVQLFQGCKSETEPINTKSVVQHVIRIHDKNSEIILSKVKLR
jgi:hypothetical protein